MLSQSVWLALSKQLKQLDQTANLGYPSILLGTRVTFFPGKLNAFSKLWVINPRLEYTISYGVLDWLINGHVSGVAYKHLLGVQLKSYNQYPSDFTFETPWRRGSY